MLDPFTHALIIDEDASLLLAFNLLGEDQEFGRMLVEQGHDAVMEDVQWREIALAAFDLDVGLLPVDVVEPAIEPAPVRSRGGLFGRIRQVGAWALACVH